ncbi:uncharacterized protein ARMOST_11869 [Armillaria ostoyae]|uniref:Uncharacterized protein n=1 Tax=Armillaria ostoyae TaxID=47428 RepID=A0A284RIB6_ARMOS|nr:uncharacterized protein ARMOST_11869 [Armillaria ostoyae]
MANIHGNLSQLARYRSDLQFPYENMVEVKRNRRHSCYPDTVLSLLPFFRRNSGLSETADLNQFPPFAQCRVSSARPQEGIAGRPYRTLCPRNPYTDDLTDGEDDGFFGWSDTSSCGSFIESIDDEASSSFWFHLGLIVTTLLIGSPEYFHCILALSPLPRPAEDQDNATNVIRHALRAGFITRTFQISPDPPAFPRWHIPADAEDIFAAQRAVQQRPSRSLPRSKALIFEARTPADAGWAIYVCLTKFYRRCWDLDTNMLIHGPPDESNFPQLPVAGNRPPRNWYSLGAYTNPRPTILSAPTAEEAVGLGVNIQCHSAMVDSILSSTRYVDSRFGDFRVPSFTSRIYNPADLALWRADGASFALYAAYTGFPINRLHPLFFLALLPPPSSDPLRYFGEITGPILQTLDRRLCDAVRAWFHLRPTDPIGRTLGDPVPQTLMTLDTELQPHHIGLNHPRTAQDHVIQTQDLLSDLVVRNTDFWRTDAFAQMRLGFHQVFYDREPELTIPRVFTNISCGPISAITYLYDCEPRSSSEIVSFIDISRSTPLLPLLPDLQGSFRRELEAFLTADISRSKALLYILTGNRNIPRWNPVFKLRFEFEILSTPGSIFVHSCLNTAMISWDSMTQTILSGNHPVLTPELWLETMFTGEAGYNTSYSGSDPLSPSRFPLDTTSDDEQAGYGCTQDVWLGEYLSWLAPKDISKLQQHGSEAYINEPFIYSDDLLTGYKVALDPSGWEKRKAEQAEAAASGVSKNEEKPKKRKQDSEGGVSVRKCKTSTTGDVKKKVPLKGKKGGKENVESEHDGKADEGIGTSKKGTSPPPAKKAKRDKEVHDESDVVNDPETLKVHEWRYRLQKTFLSNKGNPKEERMPEMDKLFRTVEAYQSVTIHYLTLWDFLQYLALDAQFSLFAQKWSPYSSMQLNVPSSRDGAKSPLPDSVNSLDVMQVVSEMWQGDDVSLSNRSSGSGADSAQQTPLSMGQVANMVLVKDVRDCPLPTTPGDSDSHNKALGSDEELLSVKFKKKEGLGHETDSRDVANPYQLLPVRGSKRILRVRLGHA